MSTPIHSVVFDVGWVLVHLDYAPLTSYLQQHGADVASMRDVIGRIGLEKHETGALAGETLLDNMASLAARPMNRAELRRRWLNMFEPQEAMLSLARDLARRYRVHLLSNVGDLHWDYMTRAYGLDRIGHGALPSYVAGFMKPHPGIYVEAERRFALTPAATVFVDDLADNVAAARSRGWHGIEHKGHASTVKALGLLGVSTQE